MSAKRLIFSLLLSVILTVTFIPAIAFGDAGDQHSITVNGYENNDEDLEEDGEPNISECGTIVVDGWTIDPEDYSSWYSEDGEASLQFWGDVYGYEEDSFGASHALIGDEIDFAPGAHDGRITEVKLNGVKLNAEDSEYHFTVLPDKGGKAGNIISVSYEKIFDDLTAEDKASAEEINAGDEKAVNTADKKVTTFKFAPKESGRYVFYSSVEDEGNADPEGRILDADGNVLMYGQDEQLNFEYFFEAEAGQVYYLQATDFWGAKTTFSVDLIENDITGIAFEPQKPWQQQDGIDTWSDDAYDDETDTYNTVYYWNDPSTEFAQGDTFTVTKKDGTTKTYKYDDYEFVNEADADDILKGRPFVDFGLMPVSEYPAGTSTNLTMKYAGCQTTVPVYFTANPFKSFEVTPSTGIKVEKYEYYSAEDDENIPLYYWNWENAKFTFTKTDGTKVEYVWEDDQLVNTAENDSLNVSYDLGWTDDEEEGSIPWEIGKTYTTTIKVAGFEQEIGVTVTGHNLTRIPAKAATYKAAGNKEYYHCNSCGRYFSDAAGKTEIEEGSWIIKKLTPKAQKVKVKAATKKVKVKKLQKKAITVAPLTVKGAKGKLSYKVVGGNAKSKKALKLNAKNGKVTVKKKTKKGNYTIKVKVTAKATASGEYKAFNKTVKVTVKVTK